MSASSDALQVVGKSLDLVGIAPTTFWLPAKCSPVRATGPCDGTGGSCTHNLCRAKAALSCSSYDPVCCLPLEGLAPPRPCGHLGLSQARLLFRQSGVDDPGRNCTSDRLVRSQMLYLLSYGALILGPGVAPDPREPQSRVPLKEHLPRKDPAPRSRTWLVEDDGFTDRPASLAV